MTRRWAASFIALALVASSVPAFLLAPAASAAPTPVGVQLRANDRKIVIGQTVNLHGRIRPKTRGQIVRIVDSNGNVKARDRTNREGYFEVRFSPQRRVQVRAVWLGAASDPVLLRVKPKVSIDMGRVRLFGKTGAHGRLLPRHPGKKVTVTLSRNGNVVARKKVRLFDGGRRYKTAFRIRKPGTHRMKVTFNDRDHLQGVARSRRKSPPLPSLSSGSRGPFVKLLERRLMGLGYYLPGSNRRYDYRTSDAMIAFNKVQGKSRVGYVTSSTWYDLASPTRLRPRSRSGKHFEVNKTKQVAFMVRGGKVRKIWHVSTGASWYGGTPSGTHYVHYKLAGYSRNRLYYPSYFDGERAFHGWPEVPTYPASHGCVRVPMWMAVWLFNRIDVGDKVIVYY